MSLAPRRPGWPQVASTSSVDPSARLAEGVIIWDLSQVREGVSVGAGTIIGRNVYVDREVSIGSNCKIQNNALLYWPATISDGVFIGPGVVLTNDPHPRAINPDGTPKGAADWEPAGVTIHAGATVGAGAVVLGGVSIGHWALVGAGAVVTRDVAPHALVVGNPAHQIGWVGKSGRRLIGSEDTLTDPSTGSRYRVLDGALEELK